MSDDEPKSVIAYAHGGFDRPIRSLTVLVTLDVIIGILLVLINIAVLFNTVQTIRHPPAPDPDDSSADVVPESVAPWQQWTVVADAAVSVGLVSLLFVAASVMGRPGKERLGTRLHIVYAVTKIVLVLALSLLWSWSVDKGRIDRGVFGAAFTTGVIHPILILALLRQIRLQIRKREGLA
jgi:hypothetical protein